MKSKFQKGYKRVRRWFHRYINGMKGAISLFLAICMLPFLSIAALLIESSRYQSVAELLQEITDSAGLSTLADYDDYLEERFGLLAADQTSDDTLEEKLDKYMTENVDVLASAATVKSVSVNGKYALNDDDIFEHQILEFSEVSATAKSIVEGLNISDVIDDLTENLIDSNLTQQIQNISDNTGDLVDVVTAMTDLFTDMDELNDKLNECKTAQTDYENKYNTFKSKLSTLAQKVKDELEADSTLTTEKLFKKSDVKRAYNEVETARKNYYNSASTYKSKFESYADQIVTVYNSVENVFDKIDDLNNNKVGDGATIVDTTLDMYNDIINTVSDLLDECYGINYETRIEAIKNEFSTQITLLNQEFDKDDVTSDWTEDANLITWLESNRYAEINTDIVSGMGYTGVGTNIEQIIEDIAELMVQDISAPANTDTISVDGYIELFTNLAGLTLMYDPTLNAKVPDGYSEGSELYAEYVTGGINDLLEASQLNYEAIEDCAAALSNPVIGVFRLISAIKKICQSVINLVTGLGQLLAGIVLFLEDIIQGLAELIYDKDELYEKYVLASYCTYNMPNRTNISSGSGLSGYSYSNITTLAETHTSYHGAKNAAASLVNFVAGEDYSWDNTMFYGAELEYIVEGTNDELGNQSSVFMALYVWRFLMNIGTVMSDGEVSLMASLAGSATAGVGSVLIYVLALFIEPLLDTILLVNGGNVYLLKDFVYCMPTGLYKYLEELESLTSLAEADKSIVDKSITKAATNAFSDFKDFKYEGFLEMGYEENLMLIMMLTVDKATLINRMQNIVSMEGITKYETDGGFALSNAYTSVYTDVEFTLNPMFNLDKLTESGLFTFHQTGYFTY